MQLSIPFNALKNGGGLSTTGGTLTTSLILAGNPQQPMEAATKQYVDGVVASIDATKITTGTLSPQYFPQFTGDVSKGLGGTDIVLSPSGVTAGSYSKANVDSRGRITAAYALGSDDIPSFSWNKITTNKPTTLVGYGITNAVNKAGDTLTNYLTLNNTPTQSLQAANKTYADNVFANNVKLSAGDVVAKATVTTPSGFLRCNGGLVSKTVYSALYAVVGDVYASYLSQPGNGKPWRQQYFINTALNNDVTGWTSAAVLPIVMFAFHAIVTRTRAYIMGGNGGGGTINNVYTAVINADGTLGNWTADTALPGTVSSGQAIVTFNRVHIIGGINGSNDSTVVYTAPINPDGTLGAWTTGTALPTGVSSAQAVVTNSFVYLLGGRINNSTATANIYTAPINADGTLGTWSLSTSSLPAPVNASHAVVTRGRIHLLGGANSTTVYTCAINTDGSLGTWTTGTALPATVSYAQSLVTRNRVYLFGGLTGAGTTFNVYTASVNADGTLGTWAAGTSLMTAMRDGQIIVTANRVYLMGGADAANTVNANVQVASFSGGLNDYSAYYNGTYAPIDPTTFRLPDYSGKESASLNIYVKY